MARLLCFERLGMLVLGSQVHIRLGDRHYSAHEYRLEFLKDATVVDLIKTRTRVERWVYLIAIQSSAYIVEIVCSEPEKEREEIRKR